MIWKEQVTWMVEIKYKRFLEKLKKKYRLEGLDVVFRIILKYTLNKQVCKVKFGLIWLTKGPLFGFWE